MSDLQTKIDAATTRLAELTASKAKRQERIESLEKDAVACEVKARELRSERLEEKQALAAEAKEASELNAILRHSQVAKTVEDSAAAQKRAQEDAEATLARLKAKETELDSVLAKAKEAAVSLETDAAGKVRIEEAPQA